MKIYFIKLNERYVTSYSFHGDSFVIDWGEQPILRGMFWSRKEAFHIRNRMRDLSAAAQNKLKGIRVVSWRGGRAERFVLEPLVRAMLINHPDMDRVSGWKTHQPLL